MLHKTTLGVAIAACLVTLVSLAFGAPSKELRQELDRFAEKVREGNARIRTACGCDMRFEIDARSYEGHDADDAHAAGFIPNSFAECAEQHCTSPHARKSWCANIKGARISRGEGPMTYANPYFTLRTKGTGYGFVDTTCQKAAAGN
jgi:hypothetical protein